MIIQILKRFLNADDIEFNWNIWANKNGIKPPFGRNHGLQASGQKLPKLPSALPQIILIQFSPSASYQTRII